MGSGAAIAAVDSLHSIGGELRELFQRLPDVDDAIADIRAVVEAVETVGRQIDALRAEVAELAERADVPHRDAGLGAMSWLKLRCGLDGGEANRRLQAGRSLRRLERTQSAYRAGEVGTPQVRRMARAFANPRCGHQLAACEDLLLDDALTQPYVEFDRLVGQWEQLADQDGAEPAAEASHRRRYVRMSRQYDGSWHLEGSLGAAQGAAVAGALERFEHAEFLADGEAAEAAGDPTRLERTAPQRRADALVAMVTAAASAPGDGRRPEPLVNIVVDQRTFEEAMVRSQGGAVAPDTRSYRDRLCTTHSGSPVPPSDAVAAAMVGQLRRVVMDGSGAVLDLGRKQRVFTGALRDAVMLRSRRCVWSGCEQDVERCQADHIVEWQHGGTTDVDNGAPMCGKHNRLKSRGYRTWCDENGTWHVRRPDGSLVA